MYLVKQTPNLFEAPTTLVEVPTKIVMTLNFDRRISNIKFKPLIYIQVPAKLND